MPVKSELLKRNHSFLLSFFETKFNAYTQSIGINWIARLKTFENPIRNALRICEIIII